MSLKSFIAPFFAKYIRNKTRKWASRPVETQQSIFKELIAVGKHTQFGKAHDFDGVVNHEDFVSRVPIRDYESLKPWVDRVVQGESDILWKGKPLYFAKTSGTTSGVKYIPLTRESMPFHIEAARDAILHYIAQTGNASFVDGKMIFLQGSPLMQEKNGIRVGRLSGIVAHYVPKYLQKNRMPSWETNCIEDWETKVEAIVDETLHENMSVISGIPSWVQMYFERIQSRTGKKVAEVFPNFNLFIYGGVNFEPYRANFERLIGKRVDSIELFPASEGFFAYQDDQHSSGMLLLLNSGIFYEFVESSTFFSENPKRLTIAEVKTGVDYVMLITSNAGLWAYNLGDTIQFVSTNPYRVIVTGRIKHFISAFGEHVIAKEVEHALKAGMQAFPETRVTEFTVAPQISPETGLPFHEWLIEFENKPSNLDKFAEVIDLALQQQNSYYFDLIQGKVLRRLVIKSISENGFRNYMKSQGKLGGQNKIPRLSNDRKIADFLTNATPN
ncbi:MAG: GH3 auxin-responsive promoter family protein [Bacteroidetes bacterium]|nr:GH3 auxin-responsive promoter family protein [Bacteroidota bacterium]